jgi:hypothetical protein
MSFTLSAKRWAKSRLFFSKKGALLLILLFSSNSFSQSGYVRFDDDPVDNWSSILSRSGVDRYYYVQNGDTLYGISKTLFGDADFWPKIWSLNSNITNPHQIEKGQVVYFAGGTLVTPPSIGLDRLKPKSYVYGASLLEPAIPPASFTQAPIQIPSTFSNVFRPMTFEEERNALGVLKTERRTVFTEPRKISLTSEITTRKPAVLGEVLRIQDSTYSGKTGELIMVKMKSDVSIGEKFRIFNYKKGIFNFYQNSNDINASLIEWTGELQIVGSSSNGDYYARLLQTNSMVRVGFLLSDESIKRVDLPDDGGDVSSFPSANVEIVGSHKGRGVLAAGESQIVYIKGGSKNGLQEGGVYPIFQSFGASVVNKNKQFVPKSSGYVKIGSVGDSVATGVLFNLSTEVATGARLGI